MTMEMRVKSRKYINYVNECIPKPYPSTSQGVAKPKAAVWTWV